MSPIPAVVAAAVMGDFASSIVKVPREVVTSRLQVASHHSPSLGVIVSEILLREGPLGFFRGFWSTTARDCPFMTILFASYEGMKLYSPLTSDSMAICIMYGGCSGGLAGFITTPFDVIKTRVMLTGQQSIKATKDQPSFMLSRSKKQEASSSMARAYSTSSTSTNATPSMVTVARTVWRNQGIGGFFVGAIPRSVWWFCVCSIFFPTYEGMKRFLKE